MGFADLRFVAPKLEGALAAPSVTVLMAVYDERPQFLEKAVSSIIAQTFRDWEFVIIDDGSDHDDTITCLEEQRNRDSRIRVIWQPHRGLIGSLNIGITMAVGSLICRQDSDDWSEPARLAKQVDFMFKEPAVAVVGSWIFFHQENGKSLWLGKLPRTTQEVSSYFPENPFCHGATCYRRSAAVAVGGYRKEASYAEDLDFFWRLCDRYSGANLPEALYHFRYTRGSISTQKSREQAITKLVISEVARARRAGLSEDYSTARLKVESEWHMAGNDMLGVLKIYDRYLLAGYSLEALRGFVTVALKRPTSGTAWAKLGRAVVFSCMPALQRRLYRNG